MPLLAERFQKTIASLKRFLKVAPLELFIIAL